MLIDADFKMSGADYDLGGFRNLQDEKYTIPPLQQTQNKSALTISARTADFG